MRIIHPRPKLGRQAFVGVEFRDGVAEVEKLHPERERALLQHRFTIERTAVLSSEGPFESLPPADDTEKVSRRRSRSTENMPGGE